MALPNEHQLTFNQYPDVKSMFAAIKTRFGGNAATKKTQKILLKQQYEKFSASSVESLDSIFNRLQKIVSRLAILGVIIAQEDLNLKILSSLPPEWNTHVVVWMNKPEVETMSIDDLYNNFKIVEQKVKKYVGTSSGAQNLAFMTALSTSSTNDANIASPQVSAASPNVNVASPQVCTAIQIHEDDLEAMDLKWQLSLLSVRAKKYYQSIGKKIFINTNDTAGYDKSKVECYNYHKLGHFARECKAPRNKEGQFRNQDDTRKQGNNKDTSLKAMLAIKGVGFDWSDMAEEQVQTNMALMAFSDSEVYTDKTCSKTCLKNYETLKKQCDDLIVKLNQTKFTAATYKRGLAIVEAQLITYRKNEVLFSEEVAVFKREGKPQHDDKGFVDSGCSRHMTGNIKLISQILRNLWSWSNNENAEQDKFADDSSTKDVNAVGQHVNTASPDVNTSSLKLNTIGSSVNIASSNEHDSPKDMFTIGVSSTLEATHIESFNNEDEPEVDLGKNTNSYAVPTTPNTRIHKDHPIDNVIGDVKSSVQTRRMTKPTSEQGFLSEIEPTSIVEILKKFNYSYVKSASTPVDLEKPMVKDGDADDVDGFFSIELFHYTDSDYAGATQDRKSTTEENYYCQAKVNAVEMTWAPKLQLLTKFLSLEALFEGGYLLIQPKAWMKECLYHKYVHKTQTKQAHIKRGRNTKNTSSSVPLTKVSVTSVPNTILGDVDAQTRFEITTKQSNDPPLSRGYTLGSGEDSMKLLELMEFCTQLSYKNR
ncbi:putative ribonuclease H-like domain-containing protein [Tanacetum coccineum]